MNEFSILQTTAEVAVAFAGFIGIVLVLAAQGGRFPIRDSLQIQVIVLASVAPVFYAAVPLVLGTLGVSGPTLWRASSGIAFLVGASSTAYLVPRMRTVPVEERPPLTSANSLAAWTLTAVATLAHLGNVLAWPWTPAAGPYLLAVWSVMVIAGMNFVSIIFRKIL